MFQMFQMDQADLDFGIYRIMNAKRDEISQFLEQDLLPTTLQEFQPAGLADKQKELADAIANAKKLKIDPDSLEVASVSATSGATAFINALGRRLRASSSWSPRLPEKRCFRAVERSERIAA